MLECMYCVCVVDRQRWIGTATWVITTTVTQWQARHAPWQAVEAAVAAAMVPTSSHHPSSCIRKHHATGLLSWLSRTTAQRWTFRGRVATGQRASVDASSTVPAVRLLQLCLLSVFFALLNTRRLGGHIQDVNNSTTVLYVIVCVGTDILAEVQSIGVLFCMMVDMGAGPAPEQVFSRLTVPQVAPKSEISIANISNKVNHSGYWTQLNEYQIHGTTTTTSYTDDQMMFLMWEL